MYSLYTRAVRRAHQSAIHIAGNSDAASADAGARSGALSASERRRLLGALALLRSSIAGERDAAALAALRVLDSAGLDWADIIGGGEWEAERVRRPQDGGDWRATTASLLRWHLHLFNDVELGFLVNVAKFSSLSPKQHSWLRRLAEKAGRVVRAA